MLALLAAVSSARAETFQNPSALVSQDPLMRQIFYRQLTQNNGGVTTAVRLATGQSVELQDPLAPLKPASGLSPSAVKKPSKNKPVKDASEQLRALDGKGRSKWPSR